MLICNGCSKNHDDNVVPLLKGFSCNYRVENTDFFGELTVDENGKCTFTFDSPTVLAGTLIIVSEECVFVEADGFAQNFNRDSLPEYSFTIGTFDVLNSANVTHLNSKGDLLFIDDVCDSGNYKIYFLHTGTIERIYLAELNTEIKISNVLKI